MLLSNLFYLELSYNLQGMFVVTWLPVFWVKIIWGQGHLQLCQYQTWSRSLLSLPGNTCSLETSFTVTINISKVCVYYFAYAYVACKANQKTEINLPSICLLVYKELISLQEFLYFP